MVDPACEHPSGILYPPYRHVSSRAVPEHRLEPPNIAATCGKHAVCCHPGELHVYPQDPAGTVGARLQAKGFGPAPVRLARAPGERGRAGARHGSVPGVHRRLGESHREPTAPVRFLSATAVSPGRWAYLHTLHMHTYTQKLALADWSARLQGPMADCFADRPASRGSANVHPLTSRPAGSPELPDSPRACCIPSPSVRQHRQCRPQCLPQTLHHRRPAALLCPSASSPSPTTAPICNTNCRHCCCCDRYRYALPTLRVSTAGQPHALRPLID